MKFSFLVPYRNRDIQRVTRCLQSLQNQSFKDFEIVFVDYGSDEMPRNQVKNLCHTLANTRYIYLHTQGWFWSRSAALNECFRQAKGDYVVVVDIDIIFPPNFLAYYDQYCTPEKVFQYQCYYIPEGFDKYENINFYQEYNYEISPIVEAGGLLVFPLQMAKDIGGFDEYFCVWGVEDMDFKARLCKNGGVLTVTDFGQVKTFHQWHAAAKRNYLTASTWLTNVEFYHRAKIATQLVLPLKAREKTANAAEFLLHKMPTHEFTFTFPVIRSFQLFTKLFFTMSAGESIRIKQDFEAIKVTNYSRLGNVVNWVNKNILEKNRLSYRLTELLTFESEYVQFGTIRDFIFYFVIENKDLIADYYLSSQEEDQLTFVVVKQ